MAKAITVNELLNYLQKEKQAGHGDYQIFITNDDEGNGYHALWYLGSLPTDWDPSTREYAEESNENIDILEDTDKAIYLG